MLFRVLSILLTTAALLHAQTAEIKKYKEAVKENPKDEKLWNDLGAAYGKIGHWKSAINSLQKAVKLKKDYAHAWYNLGLAYENAGRLTKAAEAYKEAAKHKEEFPEALFSLGVVYQKQGKLDDARKLLPNLEDQNYRMFKELERLIASTLPPAKPLPKKQ